MRTAIFAVTHGGFETAIRIQKTMDASDVFVKETIYQESLEDSDSGKEDAKQFDENALKEQRLHLYTNLAVTLQKAFASYDALICVMATGIVVRLLAPVLQDKLKDPAVLVVDETGKFVISLLSGHMGGANRLTGELAVKIKATPVITTATDREGMLAPDSIAEKLALRPTPKEQIQVLNSALLKGKTPIYLINTRLITGDFYRKELHRLGIQATPIYSDTVLGAHGNIVFITDEKELVYNPRVLNLVPRRLIAGVGCRAGTGRDEIIGALKAATKKLGVSVRHISSIVSTVVKRDEEGLIEAAKKLNVDLQFHENLVLAYQIKKHGLSESDFVKRTIGVGNVCEAACYATIADGVLALAKTKYNRVTVALLWEK